MTEARRKLDLTNEGASIADRLADRLGRSPSEVVEIALGLFDGCVTDQAKGEAAGTGRKPPVNETSPALGAGFYLAIPGRTSGTSAFARVHLGRP